MEDEYNGKDRRSRDRDHDTLTRIDENLSNFMRRFSDHINDDKNGFSKLEAADKDIKEKIDVRLSRVERWIWMGLGGLAVLEFILRKG